MTFSAEVLLMIAVLGLYLYDSAQLLYCNEAVLMPAGQRGWKVGFGSENLGVRGKELYMPNPLQPHRPMFRLCWSFDNEGAAGEPWVPSLTAFSALIPLVWSMVLALFVCLPLGFFTRLGDVALLLGLLLLYFSILLALIWVWLHRRGFQLPTRRFVALAFESLVCPPFALNLIRHVAMAMPVHEDLLSAARRLQKASDWAQTRRRLIARLSNEMECEEESSARQQKLQARRERLISEVAS